MSKMVTTSYIETQTLIDLLENLSKENDIAKKKARDVSFPKTKNYTDRINSCLDAAADFGVCRGREDIIGGLLEILKNAKDKK